MTQPADPTDVYTANGITGDPIGIYTTYAKAVAKAAEDPNWPGYTDHLELNTPAMRAYYHALLTRLNLTLDDL
jgi:hypothetical protein